MNPHHQGTDRESSQETGAEVAPVQPVNPWLEAARSIPAPAPADPVQDQATQDEQDTDTEEQRPVFVGAHGGAGATAWAGILDGVDAGNINTWTAKGESAVVLVLRASLDGVTAAKTALAHHGAEAFTSALVVAAGPGRTPRRINDELKILAGAVPLARAPWVPELLIKRAVNAAPTDLPSKELNKLTTTLNHHGVHTEGENK